MSVKAMTFGVAMLVAAMPAAAQQRGTMEFGAFASGTSFASPLGMHGAWGAGGRIGMFVWHRLAFEFEGGGARASRTLGMPSVNVGVLSARLLAVPAAFGPVSVLLGAGVDHTDTYFVESFGIHGLLGAELALTPGLALRVDGIVSYMANHHYTNTVLHLGLSVFRHTSHRTVTVTRTVEGEQRPDSVSAGETRHLRAEEAGYHALRDSLAGDTVRALRVDTVSLQDVDDQLILRVQFMTDSTVLLQRSLPVLDTIALAMHETPGAHWAVEGHTDNVGDRHHNQVLSLGRAQSVVDYLVSKGVDRRSLEARGYGQERPVFSNATLAGRAQNRRVQLRRIPPPPTGPVVP